MKGRNLAIRRARGGQHLRPCLGGCGRMVKTPRCRGCYRIHAATPLPAVLEPVGAGALRFWVPRPA